jgi:Fe-S cluster assembly protein SufD
MTPPDMTLPDVSLPTTEDEHWRYSRIAELELDRYAPAPTPEGGSVDVPPLGPRSALAVIVDGRLVASDVDADLAAKGVTIEAGGDGAGIRGIRTDGVDSLHDHLVAEVVTIVVPAGVTVPHPIVVIHTIEADGAASAPHLVVRAGEDCDVTIYDHHASGDLASLVLPQAELDVGDAARVRYVNVQLHGNRVWQLARQSSRVGKDATFSTTMVALGGDYARLAVESVMAGRGSSGTMRALYFGEGAQMHDFRTLQDHVAPHTTSDLLFKGALEGHARAVYTGLIHIGKEASGVNAFQTNRNVKLSEHAWAESVPNLEIENNDVRCSHASAVGPVDEQQRFYLESRGIRPEVAEQMIVLGFLDEVLEKFPVPDAVPAIQHELVAKLGRRQDEA